MLQPTTHTSDFDFSAPRQCVTCGNKFQGRYCNVCGEKVIAAKERTLTHFLAQVINAFTFIDNKLWQSLKTMIVSPGKMSKDICEGRTLIYMKPVAFFFVANFIYFFLGLFETFNTSLYSQMHYMPYSDWLTGLVNTHLVEHNLTLEEYARAYNQESTTWSKLLLILLAPIMLPVMALVNFKKKFLVADHFQFSMEYITYLLLVVNVGLSIVLFVVVAMGSLFGQDWQLLFGDNFTVYVFFVLLGYYLFRGVRTFYQFRWWRVIISGVLVLSSMYFVLHAYRLILFLFTFYL